MSIHKAKESRNSGQDRLKKALGEAGEREALRYLEKQGMTFVERNWHSMYGELDLVMQEGDTLCFVEVRTKRGGSPDEALATITGPKQRKLLKTAMHYLQLKRLEHLAVRFDAVGVVLGEHGFEIQHIPGAFEQIGFR